jgi:hypothetical protein
MGPPPQPLLLPKRRVTHQQTSILAPTSSFVALAALHALRRCSPPLDQVAELSAIGFLNHPVDLGVRQGHLVLTLQVELVSEPRPRGGKGKFVVVAGPARCRRR